MTIIFKKHIDACGLTKSHCLQRLLLSGFCVLDTEEVKFRELSRMSTNVGNHNRLQPFTCKLKGQIIIDSQQNQLVWKLSFSETIVKTLLAFLLVSSLWLLFGPGDWTHALLIGSFVGSLLLVTDLACMSNRVQKLTDKMYQAVLSNS